MAYYECDEVSRVCPGKKDTVSVRLTSGEKERKQKRFELANLKELYADFKKCHPNIKIGVFIICCSQSTLVCVSRVNRNSFSLCLCVPSESKANHMTRKKNRSHRLLEGSCVQFGY